MQATWHRYKALSAFVWVKQASQPWQRFLVQGETCLLATVAVWHRNTTLKKVGSYVGTRRIVLVITR